MEVFLAFYVFCHIARQSYFVDDLTGIQDIYRRLINEQRIVQYTHPPQRRAEPDAIKVNGSMWCLL